MKAYILRSDSLQQCQAQTGCRILVMDQGAVRFDFPKDWLACADGQHVRVIDREPPYNRCGLIASCRTISMPMSAFPVAELLREITLEESDCRPITRRGSIIRIFRPPLEAAWIQMHFVDAIQRREACTRVCLARGGRTLATIVFDFWPEDEVRLHFAWTTLLETLAVGDYIEDPVTGRKREKRG